MKRVLILIFMCVLAVPAGVFAVETVATERIQFFIEESGNWSLADIETGISWRGEWLTADLMKVSGTDGSCFILTEREGDIVELDCANLTQISVFFSR